MNVLLVDDQVRVLEATKKLVDWGSLGIEKVHTAECAEDARAILEKEPIAIMLTDIEMPDEDGIALQRWQAEHHPEILCIFLTSHADFGYAQEAIRNGAFDYIVQPASIPEIEEVLTRAVKELIERSAAIGLDSNMDTFVAEVMSNGLEWSNWIAKNDRDLVHNQIVNMLDYMEAEGKLLPGYLRSIHHTFLHACSNACYLNKVELKELLKDNDISYEQVSQGYHTREELLQAVDRCLWAFEMLARQRSEANQPSTPERRIRELLWYLGENLGKMISRKDAAAYVFLNEDYFTRVFRKETGMGYKEYVLKQKMEYAEKLLSSTDLPITVIASKVGYDSYNNFTQMFRKVMGLTPTDYRKQSHGDDGKDS